MNKNKEIWEICVFCGKEFPCPPCHLARLTRESIREKSYGWKEISKPEIFRYHANYQNYIKKTKQPSLKKYHE